MNTLNIDIETFSSVELASAGVYKYAESDDFEIMLIGFSMNQEPVKVIDLANGEAVPDEFIEALVDDKVAKCAFNAAFERVCLSKWLKKNYPNKLNGEYLSPDGWYCSMVLCAYNGLPMSLEAAGKALNISDKKLEAGKELVRFFAKPCKPTRVNCNRIRNLPKDAPDKWKQYIAYNKRDVEAELAIQKALQDSKVPKFVWDEYHLDQTINDTGILVDMNFVKKAVSLIDEAHEKAIDKLKNKTGLLNPRSNTQMLSYLKSQGVEVNSIAKDELSQLIKMTNEPLRSILTEFQTINKSSLKKYSAILEVACNDGRVRGMFQFAGTHTLRWAGRLVQLQNLPQNHLEDLDDARMAVINEDLEYLEVLYGTVQNLLSELIRTAFIAGEDKKFIVADYSAIEARVLSWLSCETWRNQVFRNNGDIYCASASAMFGVPVEKYGRNKELRQKGKVAELALGYGGGIEALKRMGGAGLSEEELLDIKNKWRRTNPRIVKLWNDIDKAIRHTMTTAEIVKIRNLEFKRKAGNLHIVLPSGRCIIYQQFKVKQNPENGVVEMTYMGVDSVTRKWTSIRTYGARIVENIVQAISRDLLAYSMKTLGRRKIVGSVHDELIIECCLKDDVEAVCNEMAIVPEWAQGLVLKADGYECVYYKKE